MEERRMWKRRKKIRSACSLSLSDQRHSRSRQWEMPEETHTLGNSTEQRLIVLTAALSLCLEQSLLICGIWRQRTMHVCWLKNSANWIWIREMMYLRSQNLYKYSLPPNAVLEIFFLDRAFFSVLLSISVLRWNTSHEFPSIFNPLTCVWYCVCVCDIVCVCVCVCVWEALEA